MKESIADEKLKHQYRQEYKKQDAVLPYRLFVATPGRPTVRLYANKESALSEFKDYDGRSRLIMNMKTGKIIEYAFQ